MHMSGKPPGGAEDLASEPGKTWIATPGHQGLHGSRGAINLWNAHLAKIFVKIISRR
jgi:hypothetical protein